MFGITNKIRNVIKKLTSEQDTWGRAVDRTIYTGQPPAENPDPISSERYFKIANNPYVKAGLNVRDVSRLFVSAKGLTPNEAGAYFPAQLIYTQTERGNQEQFDRLAYQYDEQFDGGFAPILRSLHQPALQYGRAIGEIHWQREDNQWVVPFIWSRDPEEYLFNPPNYKPGLYKKKHTYSSYLSGDLTRMPDGKFIYITFDPLFNNPYGQSLLRPIAKLTETWDSVYDSWRVGLKKAGFGAWLGEYGPEIAGKSTAAVAERALFLEELGKLANGTHSIFDARNAIRSEHLSFAAQAFLDFHNAYVQAVSVLLTGSATTLSEGKFGSYAKEESTSVRQKSDKEQTDALLMGMAFTYQFNRYFLNINFAQVDLIPQLQLIAPELIMPTTPEGQKTQDEEEEKVIVKTGSTEEGEQAVKLQAPEEELTKDVPRTPIKFPSKDVLPEIYLSVTEQAKAILASMPAYTKSVFDRLPDSQKSQAFTIAAIGRNLAAIQGIRDAIVNTLDDTTEETAWIAFQSEFENLRRQLKFTIAPDDMMTAFRYARQTAFSRAVDTLIDNGVGVDVIVLKTQEDTSVRMSHRRLLNIARVASDSWIRQVNFPLSFGCRCYKQPMTQQEFDVSGITLTPDEQLPDLKQIEVF